jgi:hypothetical protein
LGALEEVIKPEMPVSDRSVLFQRLGNLVDQRRFKAKERKPNKEVGATRE